MVPASELLPKEAELLRLLSKSPLLAADAAPWTKMVQDLRQRRLIERRPVRSRGEAWYLSAKGKKALEFYEFTSGDEKFFRQPVKP